MELIALVVGREKRDYSPYSLRIGGAVHMHNLGATELTIRSMGRWSMQSSTYALYIKAAFSRGVEWSKRMAVGGHMAHAPVDGNVRSGEEEGKGEPRNR